jgi:hypothetical protein
MMRAPSALAVSVFWLATATLSWSQSQPDREPCPDVTADTLGCELIAWSGLQRPVPLPDAAYPSDRQAKEQADEESRQTIPGVITKSAGQYCLRVSSEVAFVLDQQNIGESYEGRRVTITGIIDARTKRLHIESVAPIS